MVAPAAASDIDERGVRGGAADRDDLRKSNGREYRKVEVTDSVQQSNEKKKVEWEDV